MVEMFGVLLKASTNNHYCIMASWCMFSARPGTYGPQRTEHQMQEALMVSDSLRKNWPIP